MKRITVEVRVQGAVKRDEQAKVYVSYAPALRLYSQGNTQDQAIEALKSAIGLYLKVAYQENIFEKTLRRNGFLLTASPEAAEPVDNTITVLEEMGFTRSFDVPAALSLASPQAA